MSRIFDQKKLNTKNKIKILKSAWPTTSAQNCHTPSIKVRLVKIKKV